MGKGCFAYQALAFASDQRCCANPGAASAVRSSRTREIRKAAGDFWCMMFLTGKSKSGIFAESDNPYAFVRKVRARSLDGIIGHSRRDSTKRMLSLKAVSLDGCDMKRYMFLNEGVLR